MDVEKTMEFILGQQAQFSVDLASLTAETRDLAKSVRGLTEGQQVIVGAIHGLIQAGQETRDAMNEDRRRSQELREDVQRTTDNLNALIKVVDNMRNKNGSGR